MFIYSVADPGFNKRGSVNPKGGGVNPLFGQKFPENCIKKEKNWTEKGRTSLATLAWIRQCYWIDQSKVFPDFINSTEMYTTTRTLKCLHLTVNWVGWWVQPVLDDSCRNFWGNLHVQAYHWSSQRPSVKMVISTMEEWQLVSTQATPPCKCYTLQNDVPCTLTFIKDLFFDELLATKIFLAA